ncbi:MAG: SCO family protein [Acidimicrobiaceae bacterium]|nr:SCO family protein [Acidimicrobiaceae bacterium]
MSPDSPLHNFEPDDDERREIFEKLNSRRARGGRGTWVPPRFVIGVAVAFVVLGVGGAILQHFLGTPGQSLETEGAPLTLPTVGSTPSTLPANYEATIGLHLISNTAAPSFTLKTPEGAPWSLAAHEHRLVVLTFFNSACDDICPVEVKEISDVNHLLGSRASRVSFVVVNTDPHLLAPSPHIPALSGDLAQQPNVTFLTGSLPALNSVWTNYGVKVAVGHLLHQVVHNNLMYFISSSGALLGDAIPYANESANGNYSLDTGATNTFAQALATYLGTLGV